MKQVIQQVRGAVWARPCAAKARLKHLMEVAGSLIPQIKQWMQTGVVATNKIIHAGRDLGARDHQRQGAGEIRDEVADAAGSEAAICLASESRPTPTKTRCRERV